MAEKRVFVRAATGLVRSFSTADAWMYNVLTMALLTGAVYTVSTTFYSFPGANIFLGIILTAVIGLSIWVLYAILVTAMPRSGGDYIFQSRILNPGIGFTFATGGFVFWSIYWVVFSGATWAEFGITPFLQTLGTQMNDPSLISAAQWFMTLDGMFAVGIILLFVSTFQLIAPVRYYTKIQWFLMGSVLLSVGVIVGAMISVNNAGWIANFNIWAQNLGAPNDYYHGVINMAKEQGFNPSPGFNWYDTIGVIPVAWATLAWAFWSVQQAGEIKKAEDLKNQLIIIPGSGLFTALIWIIMAAGLVFVVGQEFIASIAFLAFEHPEVLITVISPYSSFFASIARPEFALVLSLILLIGFWSSSYQINYNTILGPIKIMLAGSFDRVLPEVFSEVHDRLHTPVKTALFCVFIGFLQFLAWRFIPGLETMVVAASMAQAGPILITCIAGIVFPFRSKTKQIYESSPGAKMKVGRIPLISICGVIGVIFLITIISFWATVPELGMAYPPALTYVAAVYIFLAIYYLVAKAYRKTQGIDISLAFQEIPPE